MSERRLTDEQLRRAEADADVARQYYARNGTLPTGTGLDAIDRIPAIVAELRELRALLATAMPCGWDMPGVVAGYVDAEWLHSRLDPDEAIALGAALMRAGLAAREGK